MTTKERLHPIATNLLDVPAEIIALLYDVSDKSRRHTPCAVRETVIRRGIR